MAQVKVPLCQTCAARLREIARVHGEAAMIAAMGRTLCAGCKSRVNKVYGDPDYAQPTFKKEPQ